MCIKYVEYSILYNTYLSKGAVCHPTTRKSTEENKCIKSSVEDGDIIIKWLLLMELGDYDIPN